MEWELTSEQRALRDMVREFAEGKLKPGAAKRDESGEFPWDEVRELQQMGLFGLIFPSEYGGGGRDLLSFVLAIEELARCDASVTITLLAHTLCTTHINLFASPAQKDRFLGPLVSGRKLGAWALTEPDAGSNAGGIKTVAASESQGWRLSGKKYFITNGSKADTLVIMALTDAERQAKGISAFVVPGDTPGLARGKNLDKLGFRSSDTTALMLKDLVLPRDALLGEMHQGFYQAMQVLDTGRIGVAAMAIGIARACLEDSLAYMRKRNAFGKPIGEFQAVQWMVADMATELDAARLLVHRAAVLRDLGRPFRREASMAKLFSSEAATRAALKAVQIHGGYGYTKAFPVERYLREAKLCEIGEGTSEIQRMVISRDLLKEEGVS
ncbi:acyl-CoA dehydrogenase family protein [Geomonas sp. RF6]|uniref:acyl-CoA dehydrogenase family protein n=1 Tax=Geomonas sp. RF6 TaxID=2897342 RepID=UPI001E5B2047|nr:acyl-CoA dehydrogenase family protein [Geomonas sp. RF6]UFS70913.1 acyl-CoA dehydrogenase family protein [Geomonas sp. RF6]